MRTAARSRRGRPGFTSATPSRYRQAMAPTSNGITLGWSGSLPEQDGRDALFGQEVDGLRVEGRRQGQRDDEARVPEQPVIDRVEVERRDASGYEVERIGRKLQQPAD